MDDLIVGIGVFLAFIVWMMIKLFFKLATWIFWAIIFVIATIGYYLFKLVSG